MKRSLTALKLGVIAGLLVAFRDIPRRITGFDLQEPLTLLRACSLVAVTYAVIGILAGIGAWLILGLVARIFDRRGQDETSAPTIVGLLAVALAILWIPLPPDWTSGVWFTIVSLALLLETARRLGTIRSVGPLDTWFPFGFGVLVADGVLFVAVRQIGEAGRDGWLALIALIVAVALGLAAWWLGRRLCDAVGRGDRPKLAGAALTALGVIVVVGMAAGLVAWLFGGRPRVATATPDVGRENVRVIRRDV